MRRPCKPVTIPGGGAKTIRIPAAVDPFFMVNIRGRWQGLDEGICADAHDPRERARRPSACGRPRRGNGAAMRPARVGPREPVALNARREPKRALRLDDA